MENIREKEEQALKEKLVTVYFDDTPHQVPMGMSVLEAARLVHIEIPSLCYLKDINEIGTCRVCVVEIEGIRALQPSCVYPLETVLR